MSIPYTVKTGDTLTAIAKTHLGDAKRFTAIRDEHQHVLKDKHTINVGQLLMLPDDAQDLPSGCIDVPDGMAAFDAGYQPLYQAVVNAYPPAVSFLVDQLLNYCNESINATLAWLTSPESQIAPEVRSRIISSQGSWQQFLDSSSDAMQTLLAPIIRRYANDSGFRQPDGLVTATLLRSRYAQLMRLSDVQLGIIADEMSGIPTSQKFKQVSVGKDGSIWAVGGADGSIFRLYGDAGVLGWVPDKVGKAAVIAAVDWGNAWTINHAGEIWQVTDAYSIDNGGTWTQVPDYGDASKAKTVAVGVDGSVWYARATDGNLFQREGDRWRRNPCFATDVAAINKEEVWCVSTDGNLLHLANGAWITVPTYSGNADAKRISAGNDGSVWYVDTSGAVHFWQMIAEAWNRGWDQEQMGRAEMVAVRTQGEVWCLNMAGEVWRSVDTGADGYQWQQVVESGPGDDGPYMSYTVQPGDNLWTIVRRVSGLTEPEDSQQLSQVVDQIVAENRERIPHLTRNLIRPGDVLTLPFFDSGCEE